MNADRDEPSIVSPDSEVESIKAWLRDCDTTPSESAVAAIKRIGTLPLASDQRTYLQRGLGRGLGTTADPLMALHSLERLLAAPVPGDSILAILRRQPLGLDALLRLFGTSQYLGDLVIEDPSVIEWLMTGPERHDGQRLFDSLWTMAQGKCDPADQCAILRRFRHREILRIGFNDVVRESSLEVVTQDLSRLADACLEAACRLARGRLAAVHGEPRGATGRPLRFVVLALGKLGGEELNYSSDIDLIFLYESDGHTSGTRPLSNGEFFSRMGSEVIRLLSDYAPGRGYRVDMRLRPEGHAGPLARSIESAVGYYETSGRTWERQALVKCRPAAGDLSLGNEFLLALEPFIYRRYLSAAEIMEIKALKRRIETRTVSAGDDLFEVKTGRGGIRDVEFVVQFLQLLHGGSDRRVRVHNTLRALHALEQVGCISGGERMVMEDAYRFLRKIEHRLQLLYDRQTHSMPRDLDAQRALALRMGYPVESPWSSHYAPAERFFYDYRTRTEQNRRILNHLLHDAFDDEAPSDVDAVVNLVLDPEPTDDMIVEALAPYAFRDPQTAYRNLMSLAQEDIEFLSQPRCRHFLAAIAPALLRAVSGTDDPDLTLTNLERVSASLGAKAVLWELFSMSPPSLGLYVALCARSRFLSEILINNPGMIDDLIDSLVFDRPFSTAAIHQELAELCRGAEELGPILRGFRNKEWLRVGTRDILGREPIRRITRELSDVADAIVHESAAALWKRQRQQVGTPTRADGKPARWAIVALGKLGGREILYHSDLDLVFIHEEDGEVAHTHPSISNARFFANLAQQVVRELAGRDDGQPLYQVDARLRPHGSSGALSVSLSAFCDYMNSTARPWEWLALGRARVVYGSSSFGKVVAERIRQLLCRAFDQSALQHAVCQARRRKNEAHGAGDLKGGPGGMADIEFLVQYLQLQCAEALGGHLAANTWDALGVLRRRRWLDPSDHRALVRAYNDYRLLESRLRLVHNQAETRLAAAASGHEFAGAAHDSATPAARDATLRLQTRLVRHAIRVSDIFERQAGIAGLGSPRAGHIQEGAS